MTIELSAFDSAEYLGSPEAQAVYLADAFETGDVAHIRHALGVVARAKGMTEIARSAGVSRESLYRSFSEGGNPSLSTVEKVLGVMGLQLTVRPIAAAPAKKARAKKAATGGSSRKVARAPELASA